MAFEARIARGGDVTVVCAQNAGLAAALDVAFAHAAHGSCRGVLSFGTAGGLAPGLRSGASVVASAVLDGAMRFDTDAHWSRALLKRLDGAAYGPLAGVAQAVVESGAKLRLGKSSGALAADMESHVAARWAATHGLPFACCRVVIDPCERSLPDAALAGLRPDGSTDIGAVLRSLARGPAQLPALMRLAGDANRARAALRDVRRRAGPAFALPSISQATVWPSRPAEWKR
jgi:hopanoid-associated phosphorylase